MTPLQLLFALCDGPLLVMRDRIPLLARLLAAQLAKPAEALTEEQLAKIGKRQEEKVAAAPGAIAVMPLHGLLMHRMDAWDEMFFGGTSIMRAQRVFSALVADDSVKAIVLDIDSPGGTFPGLPEFWSTIHAARGTKPIVAQVNALCASAAYFIASAPDEIVVTPSGRGGSIGVYTIHEDISRALDEMGVKMTLISAGKYKTEGNPFEPLGDEAKAFMQSRVDDVNAVFVDAVARGRDVTKAVVNDQFGQGRVYGAKEMVSRGMADRVAPLEETLARFGAAPPAARSRTNATKAALAEETLPQLSDFEGFLREAGFSKTQSAAIAGHGLKHLMRSESAEDQASIEGVRLGFERLFASLDGQPIPTL